MIASKANNKCPATIAIAGRVILFMAVASFIVLMSTLAPAQTQCTAQQRYDYVYKCHKVAEEHCQILNENALGLVNKHYNQCMTSEFQECMVSHCGPPRR